MSQSRTSTWSLQGPRLSRRAFATGGACAALAASVGAQAQPAAQLFEKPVYIELFTSQGCSSCPAADRLLTQALKASLAPLDVPVLDHLIVAGNHCFSFAEAGLL